MNGLQRRDVLRASAAAAILATASIGRDQASASPAGRALDARAGLPAAAPQPDIRPRSEWARGLRPTGPLSRERSGDVRFLLVHHTQTPNGYRPDAVPPRLRSIFEYHTGPKGWPDVAYNFFVDAHGGIWEGREGSLAGPVIGDANGGSQGFAQLCCFVGDHSASAPTTAAQTAMASLLAWLAGRYGIDLHAGRTISFVSRGSNRWPRGSRVTTAPVAGHRDMSLTECPGDGVYPLVGSTLLAAAQRIVGRPRAVTTPSSQQPTATPRRPRGSSSQPIEERAAGTSSPSAATGPVPSSSAATTPSDTGSHIVSPTATATPTLPWADSPPSPALSAAPQPVSSEPQNDDRLAWLAAGLIAAGAATGGAAIASHRRRSTTEPPDTEPHP